MVAKVEIDRDEAALFPTADIVDRRVGGALELLFVDGRHVMAGLAENLGNTPPQILIKLESHADFSIGRDT